MADQSGEILWDYDSTKPERPLDYLENLEKRWIDAFFAHGRSKRSAADDYGRELVITPFNGNYGQAGLVIAINGSPPKGMLVVQIHGDTASRIEYMHQLLRGRAISVKNPEPDSKTATQKAAATLWATTVELLKARKFIGDSH